MTLMQRLIRESVLITGLVTAIFGMLAAFGLDLTSEQTGSITAVLGLVFMLLRQVSTPTSEVVAQQKPDQSVPQAGPKAGIANGTDVVVVPADRLP